MTDEMAIVDDKIKKAIIKLTETDNVLVFKEKSESLERLAKYSNSSNTAVLDVSINKRIEEKFLEYFKVEKYPCLISYGIYIYDDDFFESNIKKRSELELSYLSKKVKKIVKGENLFIFIKGTPEHPECKFTRELIKILDDMSFINGRHYNYFNILTDPLLRSKMKAINKWATFPQIYIKETFMGGLDVFKDLLKNGIFNQILNID